MSQFCGYTLEIVLNDPSHTTIRGIIKKIIDKNLLVSNPIYLDGTKYKDNEALIKGTDIKDLKVVELPKKKKKGKKKDSTKQEKRTQQKKSTKENGKKIKSKLPKNRSYDDDQDVVYKQSTPSNVIETGSGWDAEDATKVKKMDDFDFQSNLEKFDKKSVFEEISKQDSINPSDRLVSVNKVAPEERKYGNNEMVLEKHKDVWDNIHDEDYSTGSNIKAKNSTTTGSSNIGSSKENDSFIDANETLIKGGIPLMDSMRLSIKETGKPAATCSPLQLAEIENISREKFHMNRQTLVENCSRNIAELIIKKVLGEFRVNSSNHNSPPLVLLLVGNNRAGSIALGTGRMLFNHGIRTIAYLLHDFEQSEDELTNEVQCNLDTFEACGGKVVTQLQSLSQILSKLDSPLEFILDGLQGYDTDLNDYIEPELTRSKELVRWCNSLDLPIMSIDIPSGLNASSGTADFGNYLKAQYLISIGLPLNSILNTYKFGYFKPSELMHFVVDNGLPKNVFRSKSSFRKFEKSWFSASWSYQLTA